VFIERLFNVSRDKLLSIPAFAWAYGKYSEVKNWLVSFAAWQLVRRWSRIARQAAQRLARQARHSIPRGAVRDAGDRSDRRESWLPARAITARQTRKPGT